MFSLVLLLHKLPPPPGQNEDDLESQPKPTQSSTIEPSRPKPTADNSESSSSDSESESSSSSSESGDEPHEEIVKELERVHADSSSDESTDDEAQEGSRKGFKTRKESFVKKPVPKSRRGRKKGIERNEFGDRVSMLDCLSIVVLGCWSLGVPVMYHEFIRLVFFRDSQR